MTVTEGIEGGAAPGRRVRRTWRRQMGAAKRQPFENEQYTFSVPQSSSAGTRGCHTNAKPERKASLERDGEVLVPSRALLRSGSPRHCFHTSCPLLLFIRPPQVPSIPDCGFQQPCWTWIPPDGGRKCAPCPVQGPRRAGLPGHTPPHFAVSLEL
eukprot:2287397-Rhodomonas_salina.1